MLWHCMKLLTKTIDDKVLGTIQKIQQIDKVRIVFFVTWLQSVITLYTAKLFETVLKLVLKLPDNWLAVPVAQLPQNIKILSAFNGNNDVTNKFKLFLRYYCDKELKEGGFSFHSLQRLMNCSMLYCSYLLTDKNGNITPDKFWQNVDKFLVQLEDNQCMKYSDTGTGLLKKQEVPFGTVKFTNSTQTASERNKQTCADIMEFINSRDTL